MSNPASLLKELVRIPSVGDPTRCQRFIESTMKKLGLETSIFRSPGIVSGETTNVVGRLRGRGSGKSLMLVAHADTVPADPVELWTHPPFGGQVRDGVMYGRGAYDDKAGLVLMLTVAQRLLREAGQLDGDLLLVSLGDDEASGASFSQLRGQGHWADGSLILDGAKLHEIVHGHFGGAWFRMRVRGTPTACFNRSSNAIAKTFEILEALRREVETANRSVPPPWNTYPAPVRLNISRIEGGEWPKNNAAMCTSEFAVNFMPPGTVEDQAKRVERVIEALCKADDWLGKNRPSIEPLPMGHNPYLQPLEGPFFKTLQRCHRAETGRPLRSGVVTGWFYGARLPQPCIMYGPGNGGKSHGADEYFELSSFGVVVPVLLRFVKEWCGYGRNGRGKRPLRAGAGEASPG